MELHESHTYGDFSLQTQIQLPNTSTNTTTNAHKSTNKQSNPSTKSC